MTTALVGGGNIFENTSPLAPCSQSRAVKDNIRPAQRPATCNCKSLSNAMRSIMLVSRRRAPRVIILNAIYENLKLYL